MKKTVRINRLYFIIIHIFLLIFLTGSLLLVFKNDINTSPFSGRNIKSCLENYFSHNRFYLLNNSNSNVEIKNGWLNFSYAVDKNSCQDLENLTNTNNIFKCNNGKVTETTRIEDPEIQEILGATNSAIEKYFTTIELTKENCKDACFNYKLMIYGDGRVTLYDESNLNITDEPFKVYTISEESIDKILNLLSDKDYLEYKSSYGENKGNNITFTLKTKVYGNYEEIVVYDKTKAPEKLKVLIDLIEGETKVNDQL